MGQEEQPQPQLQLLLPAFLSLTIPKMIRPTMIASIVTTIAVPIFSSPSVF